MKIKNVYLNLGLLFTVSLSGCMTNPSTTNQQSVSPSVNTSVSSTITPSVVVSFSPASESPTASPVIGSGSSSPMISGGSILKIEENMLNASSTDETSTVLKWQTVNSAKSYRIYQDGKLIVDNITDTTYKVINLRDSTSYTFELTAVNDNGESNKSIIKVVTLSSSRSSGGGGGGGGNSGGGTIIVNPTPTPTPSVSTSPTSSNYDINGRIL